MYSSSPQNQGSLSSLLALSPPPSSTRDARGGNTPENPSTNFGNTLEYVRQSERQQDRHLERQKLASARTDQVAREAAQDARVRADIAAERRDSKASSRPQSEQSHREEPRTSSGKDRVDTSSSAPADGKNQEDLVAKKVTAADESVNETPASTLVSETGVPVVDTQNSPALLLPEGELLAAASADKLASSSESTSTEEKLSTLFDPKAEAEAQSGLLTGHLTESNALDPDAAETAAKTGLLATSASPLTAQALTKNPANASASTVKDSLTSGDSATAADALLAKAAATKSAASGNGEPANLTQAKSGDIPFEANSKELFSRLLSGQTESTPLTRERAAALPISAQASPALDAVSRAIESLTPAGRGFVVQPSVAVPVGQPQWSQAVGDRVLWLAAQNITSAELRLDPPELGPMQVRVSVQNDQVQVTFTSPHANVREALDQGAARLREMFGEQGLNANVDVSDQALSRRQENGDGGHGKGRRGTGDGEGEVGEEVVAEVAVANIRLVDHYA